MYVDDNLRVSSAQQVTADAASEHTIDLGNVTPKNVIGSGKPVGFAVTVTAKGTHTGSSKLQAIQSAAENLGTPDIIGQVDLAAADVVVGASFFVPIAPGKPTKRYIGMYHDITGTVDYTVEAALMTLDQFHSYTAYANAYTP